jgi:hypothetical protein
VSVTLVTDSVFIKDAIAELVELLRTERGYTPDDSWRFVVDDPVTRVPFEFSDEEEAAWDRLVANGTLQRIADEHRRESDSTSS